MKLKLYEKNNVPQDVQKVIDVLNDGGIVIIPTDTTYAIACHALKEKSVERICKIKNIDPAKSRLSIVCYDLSSTSQYAKIDNTVFKLIKSYLPGPFTFILPGTTRLPKIFHNRKEVGIRMPDNPILTEISRVLDAPIMTTSLPLPEGCEPEFYIDPELIDEEFADRVDLVVDGGMGSFEQSTVVDLTGLTPEIIRQGKGIFAQ